MLTPIGTGVRAAISRRASCGGTEFSNVRFKGDDAKLLLSIKEPNRLLRSILPKQLDRRIATTYQHQLHRNDADVCQALDLAVQRGVAVRRLNPNECSKFLMAVRVYYEDLPMRAASSSMRITSNF